MRMGERGWRNLKSPYHQRNRCMMKKDEITVGGQYLAKINGKIVTVRVDNTHTTSLGAGKTTTYYDVTNLRTGRKTVFRSAAKFRGPAEPYKPAITGLHVGPLGGLTTADELEGEQCSDPTYSVAVQAAAVHAPATVPASPFASRLAAARQGRAAGTPVAGMVPNAEQEAILSVAHELGLGAGRVRCEDGMTVLVIVAGAGTGKTATLKMLEQVLPGNGQYTAFNKSLVEDSRSKFKKAAVHTTHALAFRTVGKQYAHRLGGNKVKSWQVAEMLGITDFHVLVDGPPMDREGIEWQDAARAAGYDEGNPAPEGWQPKIAKRLKADFLAGQVMVAVDKFCGSADREIGEQHFHYIDNIESPSDGKRAYTNNNIVRRYLLTFAQTAWDDLNRTDGCLPYKHDCYVKTWQLGTGDDRPIIPADYILLDEYQDTAPVFLDILKQQKHALLVMVGDDNQEIYAWRGAVNAGKSFPDAPRKLLSQSYRFGQAIADVANSVLATLDEPTDLIMRGNPELPSRVAVVDQPRCYLHRTNAGAVGRVMSAIAEGKRPHLIGKVDDIILWCKGAESLQKGLGTTHPELACFENWSEVKEYSKTAEGSDLKLMVKLVESFGARTIIDTLKDMPSEANADVVVSTAHKSKGREWDTVVLGQDFPLGNRMTDADRRLLYVAATRAKLTLDISECPPFCGGTDSNGGEDGGGTTTHIPGIRIDYTASMPTEEEQAAWLEGEKRPYPTPAHTAVATPTVTISAQTTAPAATTVKFTWCNSGGKWCVRGPANAAVGVNTEVFRKDGSSSVVTLKGVARKFEDAWVYEI